jgi:hypothetical protein
MRAQLPRPLLVAAASFSLVTLLSMSGLAHAGGTIEFGDGKSVSVGAGLRAAYTSTEDASPSGKDDSSNFNVQSVRLYINGSVSDTIGFTFNTECESCVFGQDAGDAVGAAGDIDVLDAIVRFEFNPEFNIWAGRMLTPADRIELNGPYYGLSWNQYTVPLLPSDQLGMAGLLGRDDGVVAWGNLGKFQYSVGLFDGVDGGPNSDDSLLFASRFSLNLLSMESNPGYYTSSTYFGGGDDILTLGVSYQSQADGTGTATEAVDFSGLIVDALFEKTLGESVLTIEGEYKTFDADLTVTARADPTCFCLFDGDAYFVTAAVLLPGNGAGRFQPYFRLTSNEPSGGAPDSDLTEVGVNYIIDGHNLRLNLNWTSGDANLTGFKGADVDSISIGVQIQI